MLDRLNNLFGWTPALLIASINWTRPVSFLANLLILCSLENLSTNNRKK